MNNQLPFRLCSLEAGMPLATPPEAVSPAPATISLWKVRLDRPARDVAVADAVLSTEERARAGRFHRERDRDRFTVARATLRFLLAGVLEADPRGIEFAYNQFGKPRLKGEGEEVSVRFNLAHSDGCGLYAFSLGREVGVDLERKRPDLDFLGLARKVFTPEEVAALSACGGDDRVEAFYRFWTRTEAFLKADGRGLSVPADERIDAAREERWKILDVPSFDGFSSALAVERRLISGDDGCESAGRKNRASETVQ